MEATTVAYIAVIISAIAVLYGVLKDVFGAGNSLATKFSSFKEETKKDISEYRLSLENRLSAMTNAQMQMRLDFNANVSEALNTQKIGFDAVTANIHELQTGLLKFRAEMAENYMRRDSYYKAADEVKKDFKERTDDIRRDMAENFKRVEKQLDDMTQVIEANRRATK